ncbi:MAG TPA: molybdopterin-binding protein [Candidatus Limnocylindrales bacterium]
MRVEHLEPGRSAPAGLVGAVLVRDLTVAGERWAKGRRLSEGDLESLGSLPGGRPLTVLLPETGDVHEDEAALRLAAVAVAGDAELAGLAIRGPAQSRVDLVALVGGVVMVRLAALDRLNRIDPVELFTVADGRVVAPGDLVASAKVAPHLVASSVLEAAEAITRRGGPIVRVRPFRPTRIAVVVKESVSAADRARFEASIGARIAGLGATLAGIAHVADSPEPVRQALAAATRGPHAARIVLTAGGASTDPGDAFFAGIEALGGRVVRHGVPSHPGSMLWLARVGRSAVVGLPSCGAYSRATAADLLLPLLVAGFPATAATVARLGHGGVLDRSQRFRFPAYARELEAPEG